MDDALQTLRRRAEQDPTLRPQLLVARVRAGELTQDRLDLAAYVGDVDARAALGPEVRRWTTGRVCCCGGDERDSEHGSGGDVESYTHNFTHACDYYNSPCECVVEEHVTRTERRWDSDRSLTALARGIERRGSDELRVRALLSVARVAIPRFETLQQGFHRRPRLAARDAVHRAFADAEAWLECPCEPHALRARVSAPGADSLGPGSVSAWAAARIASGDRPRMASEHDRVAIGFCRDADLLGEPAVRAAIREALTAWALA